MPFQRNDGRQLRGDFQFAAAMVEQTAEGGITWSSEEGGDDLYDKRYGEYIQKLRRDAFIKIYEPALASATEEKKAT